MALMTDSNFYKAAVSHLQSDELSVSPGVHCTLVLIDDVSLPLIHRPNSEPLVPRWMAQLKLLWPHESHQLTSFMQTGTAPTAKELLLMDALNDRCLFEYGSYVCLAGSRDCSLLPFSHVMRGYQASRILGWRRADSQSGCEMRLSGVFRLGLNGCLCPSVMRDRLPLLPAALLIGILPDVDWQLLINSGLGVNCTQEEMQTLQLVASSMGLSWNSTVSDTHRQRLIPVSSVARLQPGIHIEELQLGDCSQPTLKCPCKKCVTPPQQTAGSAGQCACEKCVRSHLVKNHEATGKTKGRKPRKQRQQASLNIDGSAAVSKQAVRKQLKDGKKRQASYSAGKRQQLGKQKRCKPAASLQTACCCKFCVLQPSSSLAMATCPQQKQIPLPTSSGQVGQNYLPKCQ